MCFIPYELAGYFNQPIEIINYVYVLTNVANIVLAFVFAIVADYYGPTSLLMVANIGSILVILTRLAAFYVSNLQLGFLLYAGSQFILAIEMDATFAIGLICISLWFPSELRTTAQAINCLADLASIICFTTLGPLFVSDVKSEATDFMHLMLVCCSFVVAALILSLLFFVQTGFSCLPKDEYLTISAQEISETFQKRFYGNSFSNKCVLFCKYSSNIVRDMFQFLKLWRSCLLIALEVSLPYSFGIVLAAAFPQILCPYGYSKTMQTVGVLSCFVVAGLFSSLIGSWINDKYNYGRIYIIGLHGWSIFIWTVLYFLMFVFQAETWLIYIFCLGMGPIYSLVSVSIELAAESAYPLGLGVVNGVVSILLNIAQVFMGLLFFSLGYEFEDPEILQENTCNITPDENNEVMAPLNYQYGYLSMLAIYGAFWIVVIFGLQINYNRRNVDIKVYRT